MNEYIVVLLSLLSGATGYLMITFWFQPILRYRDSKHKVFVDLIFYANAINAEGLNDMMKDRLHQREEANRRCAADLVACSEDLPSWYRRWLGRQKEDPANAASDLIGLSNTYAFEDAANRVERIKRHLRILTDVV